MQPRDRERTIALVGDVMLGRYVNDVIATMGPAYPWGDTLPLLAQADLTVVNLECVVSDRGRPWARTPKVFHFRADPRAIETLRIADVDVVSLANNHVLDYEEAALGDMLDRLAASGIATVGAGRDANEALQPTFVDVAGLRIALIAMTDNEPDWAATPEHPGTHFVPVTTAEPVRWHVAACVGGARRLADLVILSMHWGPNMILCPPAEHRAFARMAIDAGVDLVFGHSAHLFQGVEWYHGRPIVYDAGDFVDDYAVDPILRNDWGLLFHVRVASGNLPNRDGGSPTPPRWSIRQIEMYPVLIAEFQVNLARAPEAEGIVARATTLSAELGTSIERADGRLIVAPR